MTGSGGGTRFLYDSRVAWLGILATIVLCVLVSIDHVQASAVQEATQVAAAPPASTPATPPPADADASKAIPRPGRLLLTGFVFAMIGLAVLGWKRPG